MSSSESEDLTPVGFDPQAFRKQREKKIGRKAVVMSQQKTHQQQSNLPEQLQYINLLKRAMEILNKNKKDSFQDSKMKLPLEVKRESSTKTSMNLVEISKLLKRDEDHLMKFILNELSTTGSINQEGKLLMKGLFLKAQVQDVLRMYVEHFVVCKGCENVDETIIVKENKLYF
ncbi:eukaryotic translation initiation factor 2 subunit beta-like [Nylanderia fulva]|uniref:eukaryotic translation initiation factor 2 subunit beta-like n=1 Tax=Nylanderia fulva TaxID=613905 RepID=UPI0010FB8BCD|nr:eukaryotic translation initiation factor 2 subunit beta-like [Nylanderia fulva]